MKGISNSWSYGRCSFCINGCLLEGHHKRLLFVFLEVFGYGVAVMSIFALAKPIHGEFEGLTHAVFDHFFLGLVQSQELPEQGVKDLHEEGVAA